PCNSLYCNEKPFPDGYHAVKNDLIGHIHIKDALIDIPEATVVCTPFNTGDMQPYFKKIATALEGDGYKGAISLESVYRPDNGTFEDGFRASLSAFKNIFGNDK
ncbi:MAG: sugar phosphate isomerase/epimerase, partial [Saprospiraceae bacterium]|nr:sugar phosphate isomerase/epimerase [Saprospiraceae bacterium]